MSLQLSPERQRRIQRRRKNQDKFWKSKNGPVSRYKIDLRTGERIE